ncbi:putative receptor protein kinase ZmPK1 [Arachis duranensis]|uniref:Receptor-like serine/threonine-protein kinase n=1 Tax=Arachis duranensis TaxID=130453 RepID=A0A6P4BUA4_ARADU|nr:putative receptor protein kinase ZmPK1 [Arachis duranensis]
MYESGSEHMVFFISYRQFDYYCSLIWQIKEAMAIQVLLLLLTCFAPAAAKDTLSQGSSLSVEKPTTDILVSANGDFSAGFFQVGDNAFCFSVMFTRSQTPTPVWMANRDQPVNGKSSTLSLLKSGNLILIDAGRTPFWSTTTSSSSELHLKLNNKGNLLLQTSQGTVLWQSFDSPTDTLLPGQKLTDQAFLLSSRSTTNFSSGFYKLFFDTDNVLKCLYKGPNISSVYWPTPYNTASTNGRSTFNISRIALLDSYGAFLSSDGFQSNSTDYLATLHRKLVMDPDGNPRIYSFNQNRKMWEVTWQAINAPCTVHGLCGANSLCAYHPVNGRTCYCMQGFKVKDPNDWTHGCVPEFDEEQLSCSGKKNASIDFVILPSTEFYGYESKVYNVASLIQCRNICTQLCDNCKGFQLSFNNIRTYNCYPKTVWLNGRDSPDFSGDTYLKLPKQTLLSSKKPLKHSPMECSSRLSQPLDRFYQKPRRNSTLNFLLWFASAVGALELTAILAVWFFLFRTNKQPDHEDQRLLLSATGFQRFSYAELKRATKGFSHSHEIGRGSGGVVYKGKLDDDRFAAIKLLSSDANQGEAEFLAELSTIGMLNHMNLIDMWGYCVEGKHRVLVYEYMEHGSLADYLSSNTLDWKKRFDVAVGTAKGLAYLHEECLEWVLHCDVKPQNILLDSNFQPKVADFGLSKLLNRDERAGSGFSRIRGTRGYMAPEWVYNLPITSKVDVYSYGIVVLEMVTGKSAMETHSLDLSSRGIEQRRLVTWVSDVINGAPKTEFWVEAIADPKLEGEYEISQVEVLVKVALQCVQDDMNQRPSMSQVAEMLQPHGKTILLC